MIDIVAGSKLTVVVSQAQGNNPAKRELEEEIAAALKDDPDIDVCLLPHLYDMPRDHSGLLLLRSVPGELVVLAWLYPRATRWILDRNGVKENSPDRKIHCLDLRTYSDPEPYLDDIRRIAECGMRSAECGVNQPIPHSALHIPHSTLRRRWYPVIDYDRCTNCMECIDFCLFGVFGVDNRGRILVEEQDNCKKGCPACSRVCPENAIIFPGHKTPAIAGADGDNILAVQTGDINARNSYVVTASSTRVLWQRGKVVTGINRLIDIGRSGVVDDISIIRGNGYINYSVLNLADI